MLFEHERLDPGTREQQPGHHSGRATAHDDDIRLRPTRFLCTRFL